METDARQPALEPTLYFYLQGAKILRADPRSDVAEKALYFAFEGDVGWTPIGLLAERRNRNSKARKA